MQEKQTILSAKGLCKSFAHNGGQVHILSGMDLDIYQGDFTVWRVQCYQCRAIIQRKTREKAIADWNRRAE